MMHSQDSQTVDRLRQRDQAAYQLLYQAYYPMIERMVVRNAGTQDDAADVFQETLLVLVAQLDNEQWQLTASLKTYLYAISHKLWLQQLQKKNRYSTVTLDGLELGVEAETILPEETLRQRLERWLGRITQHCRTLIQRMFFDQQQAQEMGYKNRHTAHNQQYKCLQQIRKVAKPEDPS